MNGCKGEKLIYRLNIDKLIPFAGFVRKNLERDRQHNHEREQVDEPQCKLERLTYQKLVASGLMKDYREGRFGTVTPYDWANGC